MEGRASGDEASSVSGSDAETEIGRGTSHIHSASDEERELERFAEELNREILSENTIESSVYDTSNSEPESEEEDSHLDLGDRELAEMTEVLNKKIGIRSNLRKPMKKSCYFEVIHGGNGKKYSCLKCGSVFKSASSCTRHFKESCKKDESYSTVSQNDKLEEVTLEPQEKKKTSKKTIETLASSCSSSSSSSESSCDSESESESNTFPIVANEVKIHPSCSPPALLPSLRISKSSPASVLSCSSSNFQARSKKEVNRHVESHLRRKCFMCLICRGRLSTRDNLKRHIASEHCRPGCGREQLEQIYPQMYAEPAPLSPGTRLGRKMFMCPICKARHRMKFKFRRHLESRHCGPERSIEEVEELYPDLYYNLHEAVEGEAGDITRMKMSCEESVVPPLFSTNLLPPLRTPISVEGEVRDTSCVEPIKPEQNFPVSKKTTISCSKCGFLASNRYSFEKHFNSKHTLFGKTTSEFPCPQCGKIFREKLRVRRHLKRFHKVTLAESEAGVLKSNGTSVNSTTHAFPVSNIVERLYSEERVKFTVVSRMENCRVFHLKVRRETSFIKVMRSVGMKLKKNTKKLTFSRDCDDSEIGKHCTAGKLDGTVIVVKRKDK